MKILKVEPTTGLIPNFIYKKVTAKVYFFFTITFKVQKHKSDTYWRFTETQELIPGNKIDNFLKQQTLKA